MIYVPGYGNSNSKLMIIGDYPNKNEEESGIPLSSSMIDDLLEQCGVSREQFYFTNVIKVRPPQNDINKLSMLGKTIEDFLPQLWEEIKGINPNCILAFGETALNALTSKDGIKKWRGSVLPNCHSVLPKVVSTVHPGAILNSGESEGGMISWKDLAYISLDVRRAIEQSKFREYNVPKRNLWVAKNSGQVWNFFERNRNSPYASIDIETFKTYPMCIGIAFNNYESCCIPLFKIAGKSHSIEIAGQDRIETWRLVSEFLASDTKKIGQNFKFDQTQLEKRLRMKVNNFYFDTMLAFHCLHAELWKSLAFQTSIYTLEPYYKDEGKEFNPKVDDPERFLLYCARDAVTTYELAEMYMKDMEEMILW